MARHRTPRAKAEVSGASLKNPQRYRGGYYVVTPIGEPHEQMTEAQKAVWYELREEMPWLNGAHRTLLRLTCILVVKMNEGELGVSATHALSSLLSKLGATPVDQTKVGYRDGEEENPDERYFARSH